MGGIFQDTEFLMYIFKKQPMMVPKFSFWIWATVVMQLLTAVFHTIGLFVKQPPENDTERQMMELVTTYKIDAGAGFKPTFMNLFTALSACFSLLCFLGGFINLYLYRKNASAVIFKGVLGISLLIFTVCFVLMTSFTFLPPVVCTGLIVLFLSGAWFTVKKQPSL